MGTGQLLTTHGEASGLPPLRRKARAMTRETFDFPTGGFSPPEGRSARGFKPPAFSRFLFQSAVESAETF